MKLAFDIDMEFANLDFVLSFFDMRFPSAKIIYCHLFAVLLRNIFFDLIAVYVSLH